jgi:hypothetical protein
MVKTGEERRSSCTFADGADRRDNEYVGVRNLSRRLLLAIANRERTMAKNILETRVSEILEIHGDSRADP